MTRGQLDKSDEPNRWYLAASGLIGLRSIMVMSSTPEKDHGASSTVPSVLLAEAPQ